MYIIKKKLDKESQQFVTDGIRGEKKFDCFRYGRFEAKSDKSRYYKYKKKVDRSEVNLKEII